MYASQAGHTYFEGDTSQSERLEISLGSLHWTQDETFFTGADVVLPVAVEWTHTDRERAANSGLTACLHDAYCKRCTM